MAGLASYINRQARHNLLFTSHEAEDINYVDVGSLLASEIESHLQDKRLCMKAEDALRKRELCVEQHCWVLLCVIEQDIHSEIFP